ncbi:piggyBac transposable element-derived protein 4 [Trichonephila clavipes]|nr:piggyBac transposable element-derived protein 4 [Trichonephila clavipes]
MIQERKRGLITKSWTLKIVEVMLLSVGYIFYCKSGSSRSPKQFRMVPIEKIISENHRDEFSATSGRPSISPSPLGLTSGHFPVIPATKKSQIQRDSVLYALVRGIPEVGQ